jgi:hypothetical protein
MSEYPSFGVLRARLLDSRELDARSLPGTESEKANSGLHSPVRHRVGRFCAGSRRHSGMHVPDLGKRRLDGDENEAGPDVGDLDGAGCRRLLDLTRADPSGDVVNGRLQALR